MPYQFTIEFPQSFIPFQTEFWNRSYNELLEDITSVAKKSFFFLASAVACLAFCYYQPYLFMVGFFLAVFFTKEVQERTNKITELWNQSFGTQCALVALGVLTLPVTASILSIWAGTQCGLWFMPSRIEQN